MKYTKSASLVNWFKKKKVRIVLPVMTAIYVSPTRCGQFVHW